MRKALGLLSLLVFTALAAGESIAAEPRPLHLSLQPDVDSVYAPPEPFSEEQGTNLGGVNFRLDVSYLTDYIWRGIDRSESGGSEDSPNLQFDGELRWKLKKIQPFIGVFVNVYDSDPLSRFQEIRPYLGVEINARPIIFTIGHNSYIFPDRDDFNTGEFWGQIKLDDSYFFRTADPIFSPYVFAAYDYDTYNGLYVELGISHDFQVEDMPLVITPRASVAYVEGNKAFATAPPGTPDSAFFAGDSGSGFQHYQVGVEATYGLNQLLNIPARYGDLDLKGYLFYTDNIDNDLRADTQVWGGMGISFKY